MAKKKNTHIGRTLGEFVKAQRAKDPDFAEEWDKRKLARRIRALREAQNWTQAQMAIRVRTTQSAIARLESGQVLPKLDLLHKIAKAMKLRLDVNFTNPNSARPSRRAA